MKNFLLIISLFFSLSLSAQKDLQWLKLKSYRIAILSDSLKENSGLEFFNKKLYTFNDSGNSADLFELDRKSGKIVEVFPTKLKNRDWEAIASDSAKIYIGDFGNNNGTRKDLKILKFFPQKSLSDSISTSVEIPFYFPEQNDFDPKNLNTDFDAEAMIFLNGSIHLFTKEWRSKFTTHYIIDPHISANQSAHRVENFPIGFAVTDAAYFEKKLYLIGYTKKTEVYLSIFNEDKSGLFFEQKPQKFYLGTALSLGQIEGIAVDESGIFISGEEFVTPFGKYRQRLYFVPHEKFR